MYIIGVIILSLSLMATTSDEREDTLNIASYNSKGFSDNRVEIIKELLAYNNIVFIQEHWQFEEQLHKLNIDNRHMAIAVSGMDSSSHIQLGRPYGGVAIIWDKNINKYIQSIDTESKRVAAVLFTNATDKFYLLLFTCLAIQAYAMLIGLLKTSMMFSQRYLGLYTCMMNTR